MKKKKEKMYIDIKETCSVKKVIIFVGLIIIIFTENIFAVTHPNLFVNQTEIDQIKQNVFTNKYSWAVNAYNSTKAYADSNTGAVIPSLPVDSSKNAQHKIVMREALYSAVIYVLTGTVSYADEAKRILVEYAAAPTNRPSRTLETGEWTSGLSGAYDLIYNYSGLTSTNKTDIETMLKVHAQYLTTNKRTISNWQSWHNAGISAAGFVTGDTTLITTAIEDTSNGFKYQVANSIGDDGVWFESSCDYSFYALDALIITAEGARHNSIDLYNYKSSNNHTLKMMFDAPILYVDSVFLSNSKGDGGVRNLTSQAAYEVGYSRYDDPAYGWIINQGSRSGGGGIVFGYSMRLLFGKNITSSIKPNSPTMNFHIIGWGVLKSAPQDQYFGSNSLLALLDYGKRGGDHHHADKLSLDIKGYKYVLTRDDNLYSYGNSGHLGWDRQTIAHNIVVVDKTSMAGAEQEFDWNGVSGQLIYFGTAPVLQVVQGSADTAYTGVGYRRMIVMTDTYVVDTFRLNSAANHTYDYAIRANDVDGNIETTGLTLAASSLGSNTEGYQYITNVNKATTSGQWAVKWQGKSGDVTWTGGLKTYMIDFVNTEVYTGSAPGAPMIIARRNVKNTVYVAVHEPYGSGATPKIESITKLLDTQGATGIKIQRDTWTDVVLLDQDTPSENIYDIYSFDGKAALVRKDTTNKITKISILEGTSLKENGIILVTTNGIRSKISSAGGLVEITGIGIINYRVWAPSAISVEINGSAVSFNQDGDYVTNSASDSIAPATITTLTTNNPTTSSIVLSWSAPGDDGIIGTASVYDIRYATFSITTNNWGIVTQCTGEPTPQIYGTNQTYTVSGLVPSTTYYFAIKTADEVPNWSGLSNVVSNTTLESPISPIDIMHPQVLINSPQDKSSVFGMITIEVFASDEYGINRVEFYIDDQLKYRDDMLPYEWLWNTKEFPDGKHNIKVVAYDNNNNSSQKEITVKVMKEVINYPNPYIKGKSLNEIITFANLPKESTIMIYTLSGELVKTIKHKDTVDGGTEDWDISGIAGGVYLYTIVSPVSNKKVGKISIIK